jgi:hypothetical protein
MIWFRRIIAVPLALVFVVLFIVLLVVHRTNATVGNPDFYIDRLRQADIYNFTYNDVLPATLEEIEDDTSDFPVDVALLKSHVPGMVEEALPPEWLQAQVEQVINQVLPYILGDTDSFSVDIPLKDRVEAVAGAVKDTLHDEEFFDDLYEQGVQFGVDQYKEMEDLPSFLQLSDDEVVSLLRSVLPADWIQSQVDANIDAIVPYFTKDIENFTLRIDVSGRMDSLESAMTDILMKTAAYDYVLDEFIVPYLRDNTQDVMELPVGVVFTDTEIIDVVKEVLTPDWYRARVTDIVGQVFAYLKGTTETISIVISLADLEPVIVKTLVHLADSKLEALVNSLPVGTPEQVADLLASPPQGVLPPYRTPDMSYTDFKELLGIDIKNMTESAVEIWLPDQFEITDADIHETFAETGEEDVLTKARDLVQDGITYTAVDLREDMADDIDTIDDARQYIATDYTFTDADLQKYIVDSDDPNAAEQWQSYQDVRSIIGTARHWLWPAWLIPALLLVGIGFLGGRNWRSRVVWSASVLAIASLIVYVAFGPVFSAVAQPRIDDAFIEAVGKAEGVQALAADKGVAIAQNAIDSFVGGINIQAIVLLVVSLVAIAVVVLQPWRRWRKSIQETVPPDEIPPPDEPQDLPDEPTG